MGGDPAFRALLHLVTRGNSQSSAALHFRKTLVTFAHQHPSRDCVLG
jgi:hypothetical protein